MLAIAAVGMARVLTQHWREGAVLLGGALLVAAALRMLLPTERSGLLAIRSRVIDVLCYVGFGLAMVVARGDDHPRFAHRRLSRGRAGSLGMTDEARSARIVDTLVEAFADLMRADPAAFRTKFRKMAADPFAFYRGSACLFYADVAERDDPWADERTGRVWIQGDLHAENFGTYMDGDGVLIFDVNDFDEAYVGHFTWDVTRFAASLALLGWRKALSDDDITELVARLRARLPRPGPLVRRPGRRPQLLAAAGHHRRRRGPGAAAGQAAHPGRAAGRDHRDRGLRPDPARRARPAPARRRRAGRGARRVRALPRLDPGVASGCAGSATR